jgi:predicted nucleic acid-binding Zn ribbon protein
MTYADYRCPSCSKVCDVSVPVPSNTTVECQQCRVEMKRVWSPVAIGRVPGAGGSPARGSK